LASKTDSEWLSITPSSDPRMILTLGVAEGLRIKLRRKLAGNTTLPFMSDRFTGCGSGTVASR